MDDDNILYVGVIGYSQQTFNEDDAMEMLEDAFDTIEDEYIINGEYDDIVVVSGLTNMGIPKLAYELADEKEYETVGIAPEVANEFDHYDVDEIKIVGTNWGDESQLLIDTIDVLVKVGGGVQAEKELAMAQDEDISILEYDLDILD